MEMQEIIKMKDADLSKLLMDKRDGYRTLRFDTTGTKTRNVKEGLATRKDIARIMTEINKRKIESLKVSR
jgi:ribosomal protein L29